MKYFRNSALNENFGALMTLAVGLLLFISPRTAPYTLVRVGGFLMLLSGISGLLGTIGNMSRSADFTGAVIRTALGAFMVLSAPTVTRLIIAIIGIYLVLTSLVGFGASKQGGAPAILSIIPLVIGVLLLVNPLGALMTAMKWSGVALMATGAINLTTGTALRRR